MAIISGWQKSTTTACRPRVQDRRRIETAWLLVAQTSGPPSQAARTNLTLSTSFRRFRWGLRPLYYHQRHRSVLSPARRVSASLDPIEELARQQRHQRRSGRHEGRLRRQRRRRRARKIPVRHLPYFLIFPCHFRSELRLQKLYLQIKILMCIRFQFFQKSTEFSRH